MINYCITQYIHMSYWVMDNLFFSITMHQRIPINLVLSGELNDAEIVLMLKKFSCQHFIFGRDGT